MLAEFAAMRRTEGADKWLLGSVRENFLERLRFAEHPSNSLVGGRGVDVWSYRASILIK